VPWSCWWSWILIFVRPILTARNILAICPRPFRRLSAKTATVLCGSLSILPNQI